MKRKKVTQKQIAEKLNISQAVVSMVLRGNKANVSPDTRRNILALSNDMGYTSAQANMPESGEQRYVGILISRELVSYENQFIYETIVTLQETLAQCGVISTIHVCDDEKIPKSALDNSFALISTFSMASIAKSKIDIPIINVNSLDLSCTNDQVLPDNRGGVRLALNYLLEKGHKRIGFYGIKDFHVQHRERYESYKNLLDEYELESREDWVFTSKRQDRSLKEHHRLAKAALAQFVALEERPTTIVCASDGDALSLIKYAAEFNIDVPNDLSIISFDNTEEGEVCSPRLTTLSPPRKEMGHLAAKMIMDTENLSVKRKVLLNYSLIERDSVKSLMG